MRHTQLTQKYWALFKSLQPYSAELPSRRRVILLQLKKFLHGIGGFEFSVTKIYILGDNKLIVTHASI